MGLPLVAPTYPGSFLHVAALLPSFPTLLPTLPLAAVLHDGAMDTVPSLYKYIKFNHFNSYVIFAAVLAVHGAAVWRSWAGFKTQDQVGTKGIRVQ